MKLTVLLDNNTLIDRYFLGEPGVSYLIEEQGKKILFDVGYSDAFLQNASKMGIDLLNVDYIVLSHGHMDHSWGLFPLVRLHTEALIEKKKRKRPVLIAHPDVFLTRTLDPMSEIGSLLSSDKLARHFEMKLTPDPVWISENLVFLGRIERSFPFEARQSIGRIKRASGEETDDFIEDDSALAFKSGDGLVIITGCSHSGICNITETARKICGESCVKDILGGFHLLHPPRDQMEGTLEYFRNLRPKTLHACHCTDLASKIALAGVCPLEEVGVGLSLEYHPHI